MAEKLTLLRDRALGSIKNILRFTETINESTTLEAVISRREILEDRYQIFNELEIQLLDFPKYVSILYEVEEIYLKARELLMRASAKLGQAEPSRTTDLNATLEQFMYQQKTLYEEMNTSHHVRLPKINIAKFSGDYKYWASFHDLFKTTVHDNPKISKVQKLQILNSVLEGEASALIRHISITENNYVEAWEKLCNRYNKLTPIIASLIHTFMDQRPCVQPNGKVLRKVCDTADEIIRGLRALGPRAESRDPWLIHILLSKIDNESKQLWANDAVGTDFPTVNELIAFLNKRCDALEICDVTTKKSTSKPSAKTFLVANNISHHNNYECIVCKQQHPLFKCPDFKNRTMESRLKLVADNNLCRNCLKKGHTSVKCLNRASCLICNNRHHTLLHQAENDASQISSQTTSKNHASFHQNSHDQSSHSSTKPPPTIEQKQIDNSQTTSQVYHTHLSTTTTVLPTAIIHIISRTGKLQPFRALLDSGSQTSFVTESCAQSLNLPRHPSSLSIYGLASTSAGHTNEKINMTISSRFDPAYKLSITAHIINQIANLLPTNPIKYPSTLINNMNLADSQFFQPNKIDVLLGADVFFEILNPEKLIIKDIPPLQSSKFGWLVAGNLENQTQPILMMHATTESSNQHQTDDLSIQTTQCIKEITNNLSKQPTDDNNSNVSKDSTYLNSKVKTDLQLQTTAVNHIQPSVPEKNQKLSTRRTSHTTYHWKPNCSKICRSNIIDVHSKFESKFASRFEIFRLLSSGKLSSSIDNLFSSFKVGNRMDHYVHLQITNHEQQQNYCLTHSDKHETEDVFQPNQSTLRNPVPEVHFILTHQNVKTSRTTIERNQYAEIRRKSRWKETKIPVKQSYAIKFQRLVLEAVHRKAKHHRKIKFLQLTRLVFTKHRKIPGKIWCGNQSNFSGLRKSLQHLISQLIINHFDNLLMCIFPLQKFTVSFFHTSDTEHIAKFHISCTLPEEDMNPAQRQSNLRTSAHLCHQNAVPTTLAFTQFHLNGAITIHRISCTSRIYN